MRHSERAHGNSGVLPGMYTLWYMYDRRYSTTGNDGKRTAAENPADLLPTWKGTDPVREWLKELPEADRHLVGKEPLRAQWRWPVGMPLCQPMGGGLWEIRTDLPTKRTARVLLCLCHEHLVALHGFIKKTRATPDEDLALARRRQKELMR